MNDLTFRKVIYRVELESGIERMDINTAMMFCQDAIIDTVKTYNSAGERVVEDITVTGEPYKLERDVARMLSVTKESGRELSPNTDYEVWPDGRIVLPDGKYRINYLAFPDFDGMTLDSAIPMPKMFQEAVHWFVAYKYHARIEGETDTRTSYFAESYNKACEEAEHFYAGQMRPRRMPCKRIG